MILNTEDYIFAPFQHEGFSGSLYLATAKGGKLPTLLIKHKNPCSACNEFMFSRLAELLHICAPKVYLFQVAKADKDLFASPYVVGIEYIDGLRKFTLNELSDKPEWQREYSENYALAVICSQDDSVQMSMTPDGHIISFDYTECFYFPPSPAVSFDCDEDARIEYINRYLRTCERGTHNILADAGATVLQRHLNKRSIEEVYPFYHEPFKRLIALSMDEIEAATDPLYEIYPVETGIYFETYIEIMQAKLKHYLSGVEGHE